MYTNKVDIDKELTKVNPVKALTSGLFTTADIGKTVYISNSATSCQEWLVADVNHDNTIGTVDLFPKYVLSSNEMTYNSAMSYLEKTVLNGFTSEVQNAMKVQEFNLTNVSDNRLPGAYQGTATSTGSIAQSSKIKCPSLREVNCTIHASLNMYYNDSNEGKDYTLFYQKTGQYTYTTYKYGINDNFWVRIKYYQGAMPYKDYRFRIVYNYSDDYYNTPYAQPACVDYGYNPTANVIGCIRF